MFRGLWLQMRWLWDRSWTEHCREAMWVGSRVRLCPWVDTSLYTTLFTLLELRHVPPADQVIQKQATCVHHRAVFCVVSGMSPRKKTSSNPFAARWSWLKVFPLHTQPFPHPIWFCQTWRFNIRLLDASHWRGALGHICFRYTSTSRMLATHLCSAWWHSSPGFCPLHHSRVEKATSFCKVHGCCWSK